MQLIYKFYRIHRVSVWILVIMSLNTSCKKWVQIDSPKNQILTSSVFSDNATATAAQFGVFNGIFNAIILPLSKGTDLSADELTNYSIAVSDVALYSNSLTVNEESNGYTGSLWSSAYNFIYQENAILEALPNAGINESLRTQLEGEAKFSRAFLYFYLTTLFGATPIVTSTDYTINRLALRAPQEQVYSQIIADLDDAINLLSDEYRDVNLTVTTERVRPTKAAATALLARVYLYLGDLTKNNENYQKAEDLATVVIRNPAFSLLNDLNAVFIKNSKEAIWQIMPTRANMNTQEGSAFILQAAPAGNGFPNGNVTISPQLFASFETGDQRRINWVNTLVINTPAVASYIFPYKYKIKNGADLSEYEMVLRLAEQYLIRAEARAQLGEANAVDDLNAIRHRAGLGDYAGSTDKASLLAAILHERQVELFSEMGHRWLDLKRTGKVDEVMSLVTPEKASGSSWDTNQQLYPIPESDRKVNINLSQNDGYN